MGMKPLEIIALLGLLPYGLATLALFVVGLASDSVMKEDWPES